jgi:hypothetical protein
VKDDKFDGPIIMKMKRVTAVVLGLFLLLIGSLSSVAGDNWLNLSPRDKERVQRNKDRWERMPPQDKERLREEWKRWEQMPKDRRDRIKQRYDEQQRRDRDRGD